MGKSERLHRPDPERTGPIRSAATYLRDPVSGADAKSTPGEPDPSDPADVLAHGVNLGYKVIAEQIVQGQRLAQRLGKASGKTSGAESGELRALIERVLHLYKDMGTLCFDAVETLARSPALRSGIARAWQGNAESGPSSESETAFAVEIASTRRTQVSVHLKQREARFIPMAHALYATDLAIAPLTSVRFKIEPASTSLMLQVEIPDAQPPANYTGVIVDSASNEPRGTLCVRLFD
jgi:hypothetical protein